MVRHLIAAVLAALSFMAAAAVDVNKASTAELESIKGIGPALSAKIGTARQQGPFKDWADLVDRVSGLGPGNAARLSQGGLTVAGAAYAATAPATTATAKPAAPRAAKAKDKAQANAAIAIADTAAEPTRKPARMRKAAAAE
jgi:competence protein ComEA